MDIKSLQKACIYVSFTVKNIIEINQTIIEDAEDEANVSLRNIDWG